MYLINIYQSVLFCELNSKIIRLKCIEILRKYINEDLINNNEIPEDKVEAAKLTSLKIREYLLL